MRNFTLLFLMVFSLTISAQEFSTPDSGVHWTLADLMDESSELIEFSDSIYRIKQDFVVSENDTLSFLAGDNIHIDGDVKITIIGTWLSLGSEENMVKINATDSLAYNGFRLNEESSAHIDFTEIQNGGGIFAVTPDFTITNSVLKYNRTGGINTSGTINLFNGSPLIANNIFYKNELAAISSGANVNASPKILNNYIEANTQSNQNRPQLNLGSTGADTLRIIGNTILGDRDKTKVGGISVSNLLGGMINATIEDNIIRDNRYGINIQGAGNSKVHIINNIIEDNDTEGNPALGGSGISMSSSSTSQVVYLTGNEIRRNLWGVTVINQATANLGDDDENPGKNIFSENGNAGEIFALYNNTPNTITAKYNCWIEGEENTLEEVAEVIVDQADDESLGEVIYDPVFCEALSVPSIEKDSFRIYPNPAVDVIHLDNSAGLEKVSIFDLSGKRILEYNLNEGENNLNFNLNSGLYILKFEGKNRQLTKKLIVQ